MNRSKDDRGQVLSSLVAVLAVVAIVAGLLVLFGTSGDDSVADTKPSTTPSAKPSSTTPAPTSAPVTTAAPTAPTSAPTTVPTAEPTTAPTTAPSTVPPVKTLAPAQRPAVEVYNNTNRKGLADSVAGRARQAGWTVTGADNWRGKIVASTVYYPAGMLSEATQLAKDIGIGRVKDALPNMKKDRLSVILTSDYTG